MFAVARAIGVYGLLYASVITAIGITGIPRTVGLIQPLLMFLAVGGSRALARYWLGGIYQSHLQIAALPRALSMALAVPDGSWFLRWTTVLRCA